MRTIKELLQMVLEGLIDIRNRGLEFDVHVHGGLCGMIDEPWLRAKYQDINDHDVRLYRNCISLNAPSISVRRANRPDSMPHMVPAYWWPYTDIQSRINFIQNLINNIETNENN